LHNYAKRTLIDFGKTGNFCFAQLGNYRIAATIHKKTYRMYSVYISMIDFNLPMTKRELWVSRVLDRNPNLL
jgi:hypothetical protein